MDAPDVRYAKSGDLSIAEGGPMTILFAATYPERTAAAVLYGTGASYVAAEAGPSEVLVSSTVKDIVAGSGIEFRDRGEAALKGVPGAGRLFAVERGSAPS